MTTIRLGKEIGSGGCSRVFSAHDLSAGRVVALKTSRVSLRVKRTLLHYEANLMCLLTGHPSIPAVLAYGRVEHFEYLAMELLGHSLGDIVKHEGRQPLQFVLHVADQMLSALQHIHNHRIIHRDIKPGNMMILANKLSVVYLIDFGIARPCPRGNPSTHNLIEERQHMVGTLVFASLNAHQGIDLGFRDDLESLAYTLLFLLRGDLPWRRLVGHGTVLGRMAQVQEKKRAWSGSRLAEGYPPVFGHLLDYARSLDFQQCPDYTHLRTQFIHVRNSPPIPGGGAINYTQPGRLEDPSAERQDCVLQPGQLVNIQIVSRESIEGYSIQATDPSYWFDPELSLSTWRNPARPAIVIDTETDRRSSYSKILVVSLGHGSPTRAIPAIPICADPSLRDSSGEKIVPEPIWPMSHTYCYAFPRAYWFYCLPDQVSTPAHWKIGSGDVELLRKKFAAPLPRNHFDNTIDDPNPDVRYEARIHFDSVEFFVDVTPLGPSTLHSTSIGDPIEWTGDRGWFDECVRIAKRRGHDDGLQWTGDDVHEDDLTSSYHEYDHEFWNDPQHERDLTLTLNLDQKETITAEPELMRILQVV